MANEAVEKAFGAICALGVPDEAHEGVRAVLEGLHAEASKTAPTFKLGDCASCGKALESPERCFWCEARAVAARAGAAASLVINMLKGGRP